MSTQPSNHEADQANELRNLFREIEESIPDHYPVREKEEIDVLNLPPRKEVHSQNKRFKFKVSKASIRLTLLILIFLGGVLYFGQNDFSSLLLRL